MKNVIDTSKDLDSYIKQQRLYLKKEFHHNGEFNFQAPALNDNYTPYSLEEIKILCNYLNLQFK